MKNSELVNSEINIITCHWPINYGAVLQAYALQKYIANLGYDVKIIDYIPPYASNHGIKGSIRLLLRWYDLLKGRISFNHFQRKYLNLTICMKGVIDPGIDDDNKLFIAGSDQIWNPILENGKDDNYFLGCVKKGIKTSYAASLGVGKIPDECLAYYKRMLQDFKMISVREQSGKDEIMNRVGIKNVECVVDPVFLLGRDQWKAVCDESCKGEDYILVYAFRRDVQIYHYAKRLAKERKCKVVAISNSLIDVKNGMDKFYWNPAPDTFVSLFMNAKEVVTNSFHGFSFSIIFKKPMHIFELNSPGNERLLYLAKRFGLGDRLLKNDKDLLNDRMTINNMEEIEKSKRYLRELLRNYAGKNN